MTHSITPRRVRLTAAAWIALFALGALDIGSQAQAARPAQAARATPPREQRAMVQTGSGGPQALRPETIPVLRPGRGQVLIRIRAASVNHVDWVLLERPAGAGPQIRRVPGLDVSGVIAAVGPGVSDRPVGTAVFGMVARVAGRLNGGYAHYAIARAASTAPKPANVSFEQAAGLGVAGVTALGALDEAHVRAGNRVLITGVAGGIGSVAAQIAVARGAVVLGTALPRHDSYLRSIGVRRVIDYRHGHIAAQAGSVDAVLDTIGGSEAIAALQAVRPGGHFVSIARAPVTSAQCAAARVHCLGSPGRAGRAPVSALLQVARLARQGKLVVNVDRVYPLMRAGEALQYSDRDHTEGKVILTVGRRP